jgi:hypothetical protein
MKGEVRQARHRLDGIRRMLFILLADAIADLRLDSPRVTSTRPRSVLHEEAERWIFGTEPCEPPYFSFEQTCDLLGFDADYLRQKLEKYR